MKKQIVTTIILSLMVNFLIGQEIKIVDRISGSVNSLIEYANCQGKRFYMMSSICDSLWINGELAVVDSCTDNQLKRYFVSVHEDGTLNFVKNLGAVSGQLTDMDTSVVLLLTFSVDTLYSADTTFVKASLSSFSGNMVAFEYGLDGDLLRAKHWASTTHGSGRPQEIIRNEDGELFFSGSFGGDTLTLDDVFAVAATGHADWPDVFSAKIDSDWECQWINIQGGTKTEIFAASALDAGQSLITTGYFDSPIFTCGQDTIINPYGFFWPDMWVSKIDDSGQCQWLWGFSDFASVDGKGVGVFSDGSFLVAGSYSGLEIEIGDTLLVNPSSEANVFLANYRQNDSFDFATQFGGVYPPKLNGLQITANDEIWICGYFLSDENVNSSYIGNVPLHAFSDGRDIYIAKLDKQGNPIKVYSMGGEDTEGISNLSLNGEDKVHFMVTSYSDSIYMNDELIPLGSGKTHLLIEVEDIINENKEPQSFLNKIEIFPNPILKNQTLNIKSNNDAKLGKVSIYNIFGQFIKTEPLNGNATQLSFPYLTSGIYLLQFINKNEEVIQVDKLIVK